jgi:diguanylate cyclase (GGDEF)-like protein
MKIKSTTHSPMGNITTQTSPANAAKVYSDAATPPQRTIRDTTSIRGIPEAEFTPKVREAILSLMEEVDNLRRELDDVKKRLAAEKQMADQDPLLPIFNRRAFVRELTKIQASIERYHGKASLVYIDLNNFKMINDNYGHQAGDQVLHEFSKRLVESVRETDVVGRLGGDEFGLILSNTKPDAASVLINRLSKGLQIRPIFWEDQTLDVSMACGVVTIEPGEDVQGIMAMADSAMYLQKSKSKEVTSPKGVGSL